MHPQLPVQIVTERLLLRPYTRPDAGMYFEAIQANRDHLIDFLPPIVEAMQSPLEAEDVIAWFETMWQRREVFVYGVWESSSGVYSGEVYLANPDWLVPSIEIGYFLVQEHTGRGYAAEAAAALIQTAFQRLGVIRIDLQCAADNTASQRVAQGLGFTLEGRQRLRQHKHNGTLVDRLWYGLLKDTTAAPSGPLAPKVAQHPES